MTPQLAFHRSVWALVLGAALGVFYGALRPLRLRRVHLADLLFMLGFFRVWLYHSFAICRSDIRIGYFLLLLAGMLLWHQTFDPGLRPIFQGIWDILSALVRFVWLPMKKILYFAKILFASGEKWVTIKCTHFWENRQKRRGKPHGKENQSKQKRKAPRSARPQRAENRSDHSDPAVHRRTGGSALGP